jgi:hypothetical protein
MAYVLSMKRKPKPTRKDTDFHNGDLRWISPGAPNQAVEKNTQREKNPSF